MDSEEVRESIGLVRQVLERGRVVVVREQGVLELGVTGQDMEEHLLRVDGESDFFRECYKYGQKYFVKSGKQHLFQVFNRAIKDSRLVQPFFEEKAGRLLRGMYRLEHNPEQLQDRESLALCPEELLHAVLANRALNF